MESSNNHTTVARSTIAAAMNITIQ